MGRTTQNHISLCNTIGVIERDKNIYYVPHQIDIYLKKINASHTKVCDCYMDLINEVLPFSSRYSNIQISSWTPEDRKLVINGTVDDFRQSRGGGLALNYLIVKRDITDTIENEEVVSHYYFAYFIDSVEQVGANSVELNVTPDYFTNFFYLNNTDEITPDYDPFNSVMKNAHIDRQHYDRFKPMAQQTSFTGKLINKWLFVDVSNVTQQRAGEIQIVSPTIVKVSLRKFVDNSEYRFIDIYKGGYLLFELNQNDNNVIDCYYAKGGNRTLIASYHKQIYYIAIEVNLDQYYPSNNININFYINYYSASYTNLEKIFSSEETFKYKYQFKDKYLQLPLGTDIAVNELTELEESLKTVTSYNDLKTIVLRLSNPKVKEIIQWFTIFGNYLFKEDILYPVKYKYISSGTTKNVVYSLGRANYKMLSSPLTHCVLPFINIPNEFPNIDKSWFQSEVRVYFNRTNTNARITLGNVNTRFKSPSDVVEYLSSIGGADYILTSFISKESPLFKNVSITTENDKIRIIYEIYLEDNVNSDLTFYDAVAGRNKSNMKSAGFGILAGFNALPNYTILKDNMNINEYVDLSSASLIDFTNMNNPSIPTTLVFTGSSNGNTVRSNLVTDPTSNVSDYFMKNFLFVLGNAEISEFNLSIPDELSSYSIANDFKEPILESEPYTFYSISMYETEQILYKSRYFRNYSSNVFTIKLKPIISFNESYKVGIIPSYKVNNVWLRYYSESLIMILNTQMPIIQDSWLEYFILNKAQMKNQYATQENNFKSGLAQAGVSGASDIVTSALKGGLSKGALGAGVGAGAGLIKTGASLVNQQISNQYQVANIRLSQQAKMSDMGAKPDTVKFAGSDLLYDALQNDMGVHISKYKIDSVSYNSIALYLERYGYQVNLFDRINIYDRAGLNYVKINSFDFVEDNFVLSEEQMKSVSQIFEEGVTLLHDKDYLHNLGESGYHNIETSIKEVI